MRYLLDLHKKRDLKTDNQFSDPIWKLIYQVSDRIWNLIIRKQTDLKTDNQESNNMVIAQNALLARFTQKEGHIIGFLIISFQIRLFPDYRLFPIYQFSDPSFCVNRASNAFCAMTILLVSWLSVFRSVCFLCISFQITHFVQWPYYWFPDYQFSDPSFSCNQFSIPNDYHFVQWLY